MKICVLGLGYIGFPTACLFARAGHEVMGIDANPSVVAGLNAGRIHVPNEDGLGELARQVLESGALTVSHTPTKADAFIICVPTPLAKNPGSERESSRPNVQGIAGSSVDTTAQAALTAPPQAAATLQNGSYATCSNLGWAGPFVDLSALEIATRSIAPQLRPGNLVIVESTVPPGTTARVVLPILQEYGWEKEDILLAHAPERVIPGSIMREMVDNDRVIGGITPEATVAAKELYAGLIEGQIFTTDATTAEFVKLIENTYRDVNIALANELAVVAEHLGVDVHEAIPMANRHPRVNILSPGPGVGGHCIPVDPYFLIQQAPGTTPLMQTARAVNDSMVHHTASIAERLSKSQGLSRWLLMGSAYKADVSDERNSPALAIAEIMSNVGLQVQIHDPYVERFNGTFESMLEAADALMITTDHSFYRELDPGLAAAKMAHRFVLDTRNCIDAAKWEAEGFIVRRIGDGRRSSEIG